VPADVVAKAARLPVFLRPLVNRLFGLIHKRRCAHRGCISLCALRGALSKRSHIVQKLLGTDEYLAAASWLGFAKTHRVSPAAFAAFFRLRALDAAPGTCLPSLPSMTLSDTTTRGAALSGSSTLHDVTRT
jgi:hypothetical protein